MLYYSSHMYTLYSILFYCILVYAALTLFAQIFICSIPLIWICVYCCEIVRYYLLDVTTLLELETQAFRYTCSNIY